MYPKLPSKFLNPYDGSKTLLIIICYLRPQVDAIVSNRDQPAEPSDAAKQAENFIEKIITETSSESSSDSESESESDDDEEDKKKRRGKFREHRKEEDPKIRDKVATPSRKQEPQKQQQAVREEPPKRNEPPVVFTLASPADTTKSFDAWKDAMVPYWQGSGMGVDNWMLESMKATHEMQSLKIVDDSVCFRCAKNKQPLTPTAIGPHLVVKLCSDCDLQVGEKPKCEKCKLPVWTTWVEQDRFKSQLGSTVEKRLHRMYPLCESCGSRRHTPCCDHNRDKAICPACQALDANDMGFIDFASRVITDYEHHQKQEKRCFQCDGMITSSGDKSEFPIMPPAVTKSGAKAWNVQLCSGCQKKNDHLQGAHECGHCKTLVIEDRLFKTRGDHIAYKFSWCKGVYSTKCSDCNDVFHSGCWLESLKLKDGPGWVLAIKKNTKCFKCQQPKLKPAAPPCWKCKEPSTTEFGHKSEAKGRSCDKHKPTLCPKCHTYNCTKLGMVLIRSYASDKDNEWLGYNCATMQGFIYEKDDTLPKKDADDERPYYRVTGNLAKGNRDLLNPDNLKRVRVSIKNDLAQKAQQTPEVPPKPQAEVEPKTVPVAQPPPVAAPQVTNDMLKKLEQENEVLKRTLSSQDSELVELRNKEQERTKLEGTLNKLRGTYKRIARVADLEESTADDEAIVQALEGSKKRRYELENQAEDLKRRRGALEKEVEHLSSALNVSQQDSGHVAQLKAQIERLTVMMNASQERAEIAERQAKEADIQMEKEREAATVHNKLVSKITEVTWAQLHKISISLDTVRDNFNTCLVSNGGMWLAMGDHLGTSALQPQMSQYLAHTRESPYYTETYNNAVNYTKLRQQDLQGLHAAFNKLATNDTSYTSENNNNNTPMVPISTSDVQRATNKVIAHRQASTQNFAQQQQLLPPQSAPQLFYPSTNDMSQSSDDFLSMIHNSQGGNMD
jgi:predicted phage tail protein